MSGSRKSGHESKPRPPPDAAEKAAIAAAAMRVTSRPPRLTVKFSQADGNKVDFVGADHSDVGGWSARLDDAFGSRGATFAISQLNLIMAACRDPDGKIDAARVNAMIAMIEAARPENELQAALAVQMAATHYAAMALLARAMRVDQIPQFESAGNMTVKLARTFALQAETIAKLQRGGEQVVRVVHVHAGAQAIVGDVTNSIDSHTRPQGGGIEQNGSQPYAKEKSAASSAPDLLPVRCEDETWASLPVTGSER